MIILKVYGSKRFKLRAEIFQQKFVKHQRNLSQSWRDFVFEITSYFEEWLGGLGINDFEGLKNLTITDLLKGHVPGDVREQIVNNWVKSIVPGDLADKLDEYESVRANVKGAHLNDTRNGIDDLQLVDIRCGQTSIKAVIDTGAQISVLHEDLISKGCGEGEGTIQIISAFGEKEIAALKLFNLKIDDGKHGSVPIMCAVSKKLVNDMLISATAYEILLENVQLFDFENQRDFEGTKDIQLEREEKLSALALGQEIDTSETNVAKSSFINLQRMDESLGSVWSQAENKQNAYDIDDGVLVHTESICGENVKQVLVTVLVLVPSSSHKLSKKWKGPAFIIELPRPHTVRVKIEDGSERELHFNKLRPYVARIEQIGPIFDKDNEFGDFHYAPTDTVELDVNDIYKHVMDSSAGLENSQKHQLADFLSKVSDVFSSVPGCAKAHRLKTDAFPMGEGVRSSKSSCQIGRK
ncbi:CCHC-type domain-containing protein [Trichonephila inaurata madagascariensis]|uniref:CCHC-type domain-containing protein n=1 Tax=Trichonephila inaurata madagascariensis TaxID=2747483 RepID=A0A8X6YDW7_9ARAC|nr:CCHC-type domain-containing protein [Trichonephila inaurata madagascariensis]